jgi:hypothetical protein
MKSNILTLFTIVAIGHLSCKRLSENQLEIRRVIGEKVELGIFMEISNKERAITMGEYRNQYRFISIVYLQNGCAPCYPKFMEWQEQIASMELPQDYTVLFVIQGKRYSQFIEEVNDYARENLGVDTVENNFPVAMDPDFDFLSSNHNIPRWIIERSVLIDSQNRIRMVGAPWATPEMTELFQRICSEGKND